MKNKNNILNISTIIIMFIILLGFTMFSKSDNNSINFSSLFNLLFLILMLSVVLTFVLINIKKAISIRNDLHRITEELRKETDWHTINFLNNDLQDTFCRYKNEMERLSKISKISDSKEPIGCDIEDYINVQFVNGLINKSLCESVSGSMTGLGLLGTFLGLIIGLKDFSTDYEGIQNSILMLLNGIKTSFLTSIYGVVFSLIFNWIYRRNYTDMINTLNEFHHEFHNKAVNNSQNDVNSRLIAAQENITGNIEKLLSLIATDISMQFKSSLNTMTTSIKQYLEMSENSQHEKLSILVNQYLKKMNEEVLGGQLEELRNTLKLINDSNAHYCNKVQELSEMISESGKSFLTMSNQYTESVESFQEYIEQVRKYQQEIATANCNLSENMKALTIRYEAQNEEMTEIVQQISNLSYVINQLSELCEKLETNITSSDNSRVKFAQNAEELIKQVKETTESAYKYTIETVEISKSVAEKLETYTESNLDDIIQVLGELSDNFKGTSENLGVVYEQLSNQLNSGLAQTFATFDTDTAEIIRKFSDIIENIRSSADYIPYKLNQALNYEFNERFKERERLLAIIRGTNEFENSAEKTADNPEIKVADDISDSDFDAVVIEDDET